MRARVIVVDLSCEVFSVVIVDSGLLDVDLLAYASACGHTPDEGRASHQDGRKRTALFFLDPQELSFDELTCLNGLLVAKLG